jgi:IS5 family transposase
VEREWAELSAAISRVDVNWRDDPRLVHRTATIVRVHLWAVVHDRPISWACDPRRWEARARPARLPDQSTMSRRTRGRHGRQFHAFLDAVAAVLDGPSRRARAGRLVSVAAVDGKALHVAAHSTDRDARWGRGTGQRAKGYKLHALVDATRRAAMPLQWAVTPLNVDERAIARRFVQRLGDGPGGYVLADALYDAADLHERSAAADRQLVCPRGKPGGGLGHRRQSRHRVRSIALTEPPARLNGFGPALLNQRRGIERGFGNLTSFGGGLQGLPAWVRRIWRVRAWVYGKLLVNAARIRHLERGGA